MIQISETENGFLVSGPSYSHAFSNRAKAIMAANLLAIAAETETGEHDRILVPMGWDEAVAVDPADLRDLPPLRAVEAGTAC